MLGSVSYVHSVPGTLVDSKTGSESGQDRRRGRTIPRACPHLPPELAPRTARSADPGGGCPPPARAARAGITVGSFLQNRVQFRGHFLFRFSRMFMICSTHGEAMSSPVRHTTPNGVRNPSLQRHPHQRAGTCNSLGFGEGDRKRAALAEFLSCDERGGRPY